MTDRIVGRNGLPTQQSLTSRPGDMSALNATRPVLGVILTVNPADNPRNRSAMQHADRRGYLHTCTVLLVQDSREVCIPLENVIITPDGPSGLDDYYEHLPRGSSRLVNGENWNNQLNNVNPYDLDGDWCLVSFLGGSVGRPFILRWWPHPRNTYDPATSGVATDNVTTLDQSGRSFVRINGVELVVTREGDVYLSTTHANESLKFSEDNSAVDGRFPRESDAENGGSVKVWIKPSQSLELDWDEQEDGMGKLDTADPSVPQTNPRETGASSSTRSRENTYVLVEKDRLHVTVPSEIKLRSKQRILLESTEDTTLTIGGDLSASIDGAVAVDAIGDITVGTDGTLTLTSEAGTRIDSTTGVTVEGQEYVEIRSPDQIVTEAPFTFIRHGSGPEDNVTIGNSDIAQVAVSANVVTLSNGELGGVVGGDNLLETLRRLSVTVRVAADATTYERAFAVVIANAIDDLLLAVQNSTSANVKVG